MLMTKLVSVPRNVLEAMLEFLQLGKAKVDPYHLSVSIEELLAASAEPAEERTPIDSPSEVCPLVGCKRRDDHQHVVIEHPNRPAEPV